MPAGDIGTNPYFEILRTDSTTHRIQIWSNTLGVLEHWSGGNDPNQSPNRIDIGQELIGTSGAQSPDTRWTDNRWVHFDGANYHFFYQARDGDFDIINNPPYAGWITPPSQSSTGGEWFATCC